MLEYIFVTQFNDGTILEQTQEDVSTSTPGKNAFFDVLQNIDEVAKFELVGKGHSYLVDLLDGHFEVDGVPFRFHEDGEQFTNRRLIFFKRNRIDIIMGTNQREHKITYRMGWQANDSSGRNIQKIMEIN